MDQLIRKANSVRNLAIVSFVFVIVGIVAGIVAVVMSANAYVIEYTDIWGHKTYELDSASNTVVLLTWVTIIACVVGGICSFVSTIMILACDWKYPELQSSKILWGVLGLFLLGWISGWVFGVKAKNYIKSNSNGIQEVTGFPVGPNADGSYL